MKKIETGTIIRTVILALALVNQLLAAAGKSPIPVNDDQISMLISTAITIATSVAAWWKNNSFTKKAIEADKFLHDTEGE